jgi:signal transduction histidine kinase
MTKGSIMSRRLVWLQLLIGWLPIWALFTTLIATMHEDATLGAAAFISFRMIVAAAILGLGVQRLTERVPWPNPVRLDFVALHFLAAVVYSIVWIALNSVIESVIHGQLMIVVGIGISSFIVVGIWLYVMIAGVSYTMQSNERAARAEAEAARSQLSALRSQLNPHFLFNALHTVVQLIPREPKVAAQAAEQVAGLLRTTLEEDRDIIAFSRELDFVQRYLEVERIRFGDRLQVQVDVSDEASAATLPSFALQTLVENAVRHGAAPKVDPTLITISGEIKNRMLVVRVTDTGVGMNNVPSNGTGLRRLRERFAALYGNSAHLTIASESSTGTTVALLIPQDSDD